MEHNITATLTLIYEAHTHNIKLTLEEAFYAYAIAQGLRERQMFEEKKKKSPEPIRT